MVTTFKTYIQESDIRHRYAMELIDKVNRDFPGGSNPKLVDKKTRLRNF